MKKEGYLCKQVQFDGKIHVTTTLERQKTVVKGFCSVHPESKCVKNSANVHVYHRVTFEFSPGKMLNSYVAFSIKESF